ncbi:MAG: exosortase-associated EpsI family protein [Phycisphaerales bacterium]|nr:exosortase-associated EpsI family protein [Phycisphaerales bacterium]
MSETNNGQNANGMGDKRLVSPSISWGAVLRQPWFLGCAAILLAFAVGFEVMAKRLNVWMIKKPLPLKIALDDMDQRKLLPYELRQQMQIHPEVVNELGTTQYIQWILEDTSRPDRHNRESWIQLFVTYYTGNPDQVPHVPEQCYLGQGNTTVEDRLIDVEIPRLGPGFTIPVHLLVFRMSATFGNRESLVLYTFHANGEFKATRTGVRTLLGNPSSRYSYFSKLELTFGVNEAMPPIDEALETGIKFLQTVVPVLVEDHWPDWEAATRESSDQP